MVSPPNSLFSFQREGEATESSTRILVIILRQICGDNFTTNYDKMPPCSCDIICHKNRHTTSRQFTTDCDNLRQFMTFSVPSRSSRPPFGFRRQIPCSLFDFLVFLATISSLFCAFCLCLPRILRVRCREYARLFQGFPCFCQDEARWTKKQGLEGQGIHSERSSGGAAGAPHIPFSHSLHWEADQQGLLRHPRNPGKPFQGS